MAGNTQMTDNERGIFSFIHGITGYLVAVVLLLSILGVLTVLAIGSQQNNATTYYEVNQDLNSIKFNSLDNNSYRTIK
jgi:succinate dehydrogenase/fumarate reductase cytochrome b subunit